MSRKRRVLQVWAPSFTDCGGIQRFSAEIVRALTGEPMACSGSGTALHFEPGTVERPSNGVSVQCFSRTETDQTIFGNPVQCGNRHHGRIRSNLGFAARVTRSMLWHRPSLVLASHLHFGPLARLVCRTRGVPYLVVAHGLDVTQGLTKSRLNGLQEANQILCVSRHTESLVRKLPGIQPEQTAILPNTIDGARFTPAVDRTTLRARFGIGADEKVILSVGRMAAREAYKGVDHILRSLPEVHSKLGPVRYLIVGTGDDRPRLENLARELGLEAKVTFAGFVPESELADHYRIADVFAMPSRGEGFGIVFLEAMACGVPVLAGNVDGSTDPLVDGELGVLVDPGSVPAIADGLIRLLRHEGPPCWFVPEQLRTRVLERFGTAAFRRRLLELLAPYGIVSA